MYHLTYVCCERSHLYTYTYKNRKANWANHWQSKFWCWAGFSAQKNLSLLRIGADEESQIFDKTIVQFSCSLEFRFTGIAQRNRGTHSHEEKLLENVLLYQFILASILWKIVTADVHRLPWSDLRTKRKEEYFYQFIWEDYVDWRTIYVKHKYGIWMCTRIWKRRCHMIYYLFYWWRNLQNASLRQNINNFIDVCVFVCVRRWRQRRYRIDIVSLR